ncbi:hypothetical protein M427DRAFT_56439 [Gonapodya prolifera JEL478]|uniref:Periplasmic binding protein-like II n=1 Tax=Gonapodya prolifera (strain JEL478) TaxID=1344416 RepID=A0A139AHI6_GONPJ|nr:hypothetical protein M427DRAFT_56439 [Gonapodya prolifera JEL478]|eukprot:KXS15873.1 hypothetical protein M427DRAFT_56439 [Gonapodya prolifera JEL478]
MIPRKYTIVALGALLLLVAASTDAAPTTVRAACPVANGTYDSTKDYFPNKAAPVFATYWNITYFSNYKLLRNKFTNEIMVLTMCNTPPPNITSAVKYFTVPINLAAVASLSVSRFFERLELRERIRYVPAISTVTSPCLQTLVQQGFTRPFPANATLATLSDVDAVFSTGGDDQVSLLTNLNITVLFRPIAENGAIARFEWIKYLSAFFNAEGTANTVFESARTLYQCNSGRVATQSKKTAAWLKPNTQNLTFVTTDPVYKNEMLADAGITPVTTSSSTDDVAFWSSVSNADVLIDDSGATSWNALLTGYGLSASPSANSSIKWVQERQVYQLNRLRDLDAYDDFTQSYLAMPEYIQSDIISIVYRTYNKDWKFIWARNVYDEDGYTNLNSTDCPDNDTASAFYRSWKQNVTCPDLPATSTSAPVAATTEGTAAPPSATASAPAPAAAATTTTATGSPQAGSSNSTGGTSTGSTAGAAIGGILAVGIVGGAAAFFFYRRRRSQGQDYLTRRQQMFAAGQIPGTDGSAVMVGEDTPPADVAGEWAGQGATGGSGEPRGEWVQMDSVEPAALNVVVSDGRQGR